MHAQSQSDKMYRFRKRSVADDTSPSPAKKPKNHAKQGNIFAAFLFQEFKAYFYDSGAKMFCKSYNVVVDQVTK